MLMVTSCQKDDAPLEVAKEAPQFEVEKLTGFQLTNNRSLNKALREAKTALGINEFRKSIFDSVNNIWIDDSQVNHVSSGSYESFTFGIYNPNDSLNKQNIVFHKQIDSTYLPILLSYESQPIDSTQSPIKYRILNSSFILNNLAKSDAGGLLDIQPCGWDYSDCLCWRIIGYEGENVITQIEVQNDCSWESSDSDETISDGNSGGGGGANTDGGDSGSGTNDGNGTAGGWSSGGQSGGTPSGDASNFNDPDEENPCDNQLTLSNDSCAGIITVPVDNLKPAPAPVDDQTQQFFDSLEQTDEELWKFINNNPYDDTRVVENKRVRENIQQFFLDNGKTPENEDLAKEFLEIAQENVGIRVERFKELKDLITNNPWVLLEDSMQEEGLNSTDFYNLYNHVIPVTCQDRLDLLGSGFVNQPISEGNVPLANIDYYAVEITTMPDLDGDGISENMSNVFAAYKSKFLEFASGNQDDFQFASDIPLDLDNKADISWQFSPLEISDYALFNSFNPVSTILKITADANGTAFLAVDHGAVILSDYQNNAQWTVSTIQTPSTGTQPFSGNRQWGINNNSNGNVELFTRAVDVAKMSFIIENDFRNSLEDKQEDYYNIADATWRNLQNEVIEWINLNGGQANISPNTTIIKVDKTKIKELLKGTDTITQINCCN